MKKVSIAALSSLFLLAVTAIAADAPGTQAKGGSGLTATVIDKKGNSAKVTTEGEATVVTFTSPTGIGNAELKRNGGAWGKIVLKFQYDDVKKFTRLEGCEVNLFVGPRDRAKVDVDIDPKTFTVTLTMPKDSEKHDVIEVAWVDAYRM